MLETVAICEYIWYNCKGIDISLAIEQMNAEQSANSKMHEELYQVETHEATAACSYFPSSQSMQETWNQGCLQNKIKMRKKFGN